jgi:hypothetical protein
MYNTILSILHRQHAYIFFLVICWFYYFSYGIMNPGDFSTDSMISYKNALEDAYSNHHPPIMAWVWRVMFHIAPHQMAGIIVLNLALFWGCIYMVGIINSRIQPIWAYIGLLIWTIPPVLVMTRVVWKDACMAFALMLACLLLHYYQRTQKPLRAPMLLCIILLLFYTVGLRHNAITAMFPITYWLVSVVYQNRWGFLRKLAMACTICTALFLGKIGFETAVVQKYVMPSQENMLFDLGYMSQILDKPLFPAYVYQDKEGGYEQLRKRLYFSWKGRYMSNEFGTSDPAKWAQLRKAYYDMLSNYPMEFIQYRWNFFKGSLGFYGSHWPYMWNALETHPNIYKAFGRGYLRYTESTLFFIPYMWVALSLIFFALASFKTILPESVRMPVFYLNLSAIFMTIPYYLLLPSPDFRYYYWQILVVIFSIMLILPAWDDRRIKRKMLTLKT